MHRSRRILYVGSFIRMHEIHLLASFTMHTSERWNWIFIHQKHTGTQFSLNLIKKTVYMLCAMSRKSFEICWHTQESSKLIKIITLCIQIAFGFRYSGLVHEHTWLPLAWLHMSRTNESNFGFWHSRIRKILQIIK